MSIDRSLQTLDSDYGLGGLVDPGKRSVGYHHEELFGGVELFHSVKIKQISCQIGVKHPVGWPVALGADFSDTLGRLFPRRH